MSRFFFVPPAASLSLSLAADAGPVTAVCGQKDECLLNYAKIKFALKFCQSLQKSIKSHIFAILCQVNFEISLSYFHTKTIFNL